MTVMVLGVTDWYCPNCKLTDQTQGLVPNRFHSCPRLYGLTAPMVREGIKAKVTATERPDYIGDEMVDHQYMNVTTERDNGQDVTVFAPTATAKVSDANQG